MSKWTYGSPTDSDIKKDGKWWATALSKSEANKIVGQLTAYEARIASLEAEVEAATDMAIHYRDSAIAGDAELSRVRAESLRVVKCGESFGIDEVERWREVFDGIYIMDDNLYECADGETVQPVRLERWEDTHDNH